MLTAAYEDERVPVWMPAKWMALLRTKCGQDADLYMNVEARGHHLSLADSQRLSAMETAFLLHAIQ